MRADVMCQRHRRSPPIKEPLENVGRRGAQQAICQTYRAQLYTLQTEISHTQQTKLDEHVQ